MKSEVLTAIAMQVSLQDIRANKDDIVITDIIKGMDVTIAIDCNCSSVGFDAYVMNSDNIELFVRHRFTFLELETERERLACKDDHWYFL